MGEIAGDFCGVVDDHNDGSRMMKEEKKVERNDYITGFGRGYSEIQAG